jgi:MoaA/NifB/PqqE/SkfB family radical SAM enzyme
MRYHNKNPIIKTYHKNYEDPMFFGCTWAVTNKCNFHCEYCETWKEQQYRGRFHLLNIINFCNYLSEKYNLLLTLYGGEPLLHPDIFYIVENLKKSKYPLHYFTNLSVEKDILKSLIEKNRFVKFLTSFHYNKTNINDFLEKIDLILENKIEIVVKVMWNSKYKNEIKDIYCEIKKKEKNHNFSCSLDMIISETTSFSQEDMIFYYNEHNNDKLKENVVEYINEAGEITSNNLTFNHIRILNKEASFLGQANFFGYSCEAGKRYLYIDENGDIYNCINDKRNKKKLCNISDKDLEYSKIIKQDKKICNSFNCSAEISIPKQRTNKTCTAPLLICVVLTEHCNWLCDYCDRPLLNKRKTLDLTTFNKYFFRIIEKYKEYPIYVSGGELGTMTEDEISIIFSSEKKLRVCTNGLFIQKGFFHKFYDKIEEVVLHIRIEKGIEVQTEDPKITYLLVIHHENVKQIKTFIEKIDPKRSWMFQYYQPKNPADYNDKFQLTKEDYFIVLKDLIKYSNYKFEYKRVLERIKQFDNPLQIKNCRENCRKEFFFPMVDFCQNKILFCKQSANFTSSVDLNEDNFYKLENNILHFNIKQDIVCKKCFEATDYFLDIGTTK